MPLFIIFPVLALGSMQTLAWKLVTEGVYRLPSVACVCVRACVRALCVCVCVCVCVHVYVVYEDTNLYNDMGMT